MQSLFFRNFSLPNLCKDHGKSNGCLVACGQPTNDTTNSYHPFNLCLNWVSTGTDMHEAINSESSVAWNITDCELNHI